MPRPLTLRFTNPNTGQVHQIKADVVEKLKAEGPEAKETFRHDVNDDKVDLYVDDTGRSRYSTDRHMFHLQIDKSQLSPEEAEALAAAMQSASPNAIELKRDTRFNAVTVRSDLQIEKKDVLGEVFQATRNLGSGAQPLYLNEAGVFSIDGQAPASLADTQQALFRAAESADALPDGTDIFTHSNASLLTKRQVIDQLEAFQTDLAQSGLDRREQAQARASAATLLTDMVASLGNTGAEGQLKKDAFGQLQSLVSHETVGGLKESMIFNLLRIQTGLGPIESMQVDVLRNQIAPATPPYDKWFKDGKTEVNMSLAAGHGEGFYEGITEFLTKRGFKVTEEGGGESWFSSGKPRILTLKKEGPNGEERTFNIHMRNFDGDSFKEINDKKFDIIGYMGHSNLGGNTRNSVENAPSATGEDKLIFLGLCSGKDNVDRVRKAFPEAQLMTTFNSSYFRKKPIPGGGSQFYEGEDAKALTELVNGIMGEQDWSEINANVRDKALGFAHDKTRGNYITPLNARMNARFRDADSDGKADLHDKHFNLDVATVRSEPSGSFEADPIVDAPDTPLNGDIPHLAAGFANTIDLYNPTFRNFHKKGRVLADGYFHGTASDPVVQFETSKVDGETAYLMKVNSAYRHLGEEALRALTMVEYNRHLVNTEPSYPIKDPVKRELLGLITGGASLVYDSGWRDDAVFSAMVKHYNLPEGLKWEHLSQLIEDEKHDYTGSERMADKWLGKMDADTKAELKAKLGPAVG